MAAALAALSGSTAAGGRGGPADNPLQNSARQQIWPRSATLPPPCQRLQPSSPAPTARYTPVTVTRSPGLARSTRSWGETRRGREGAGQPPGTWRTIPKGLSEELRGKMYPPQQPKRRARTRRPQDCLCNAALRPPPPGAQTWRRCAGSRPLGCRWGSPAPHTHTPSSLRAPLTGAAACSRAVRLPVPPRICAHTAQPPATQQQGTLPAPALPTPAAPSPPLRTQPPPARILPSLPCSPARPTRPHRPASS